MEKKPISSFKISRFINEEAYGGIILILATIAALFWANSTFYESYHHIWHEYKVGFVWGDINMVASLHHWINDGLMALFFFVVGLEIKREVMLVDASQAIPIVFNKLIKNKAHIAIVVDEFGNMIGLVSMEDIIETLLGLEIMDESDNIEDMQLLARKNWESRAKRLGLISTNDTTTKNTSNTPK